MGKNWDEASFEPIRKSGRGTSASSRGGKRHISSRNKSGSQHEPKSSMGLEQLGYLIAEKKIKSRLKELEGKWKQELSHYELDDARKKYFDWLTESINENDGLAVMNEKEGVVDIDTSDYYENGIITTTHLINGYVTKSNRDKDNDSMDLVISDALDKLDKLSYDELNVWRSTSPEFQRQFGLKLKPLPLKTAS